MRAPAPRPVGPRRALATALLLLAVAAPAPGRAQGAAPWQGPGVAPQAAAAERSAPVRVEAVAGVGLTVSDLARSVDFYTRVLDFERVTELERAGPAFERLVGVPGARARVARLRLGDELLELTEYVRPRGRPAPVGARSNDRGFQHVAVIVRDMEGAFARLRRFGVRATSAAGPERLPDWNPAVRGIRAFYFRDPDGHPLEILQFPPGKGSARWHRPGDRLFLGIDHTAIVVRHTERSLAFYRDALGFAVAGGSENYGPEQERLSGVPGAHLRITTLRASAGPGIEFLEYLAPRDGRPFPAGERANDLIHWHTRIVVPSAVLAAARLRAGGAALVSDGGVVRLDPSSDARLALRVRDPDGHVLELLQP